MTRRHRTYLEYWQDGEEWVATEPDATTDITGTGPTAPLAAADYCERVEDSPPAEAPADD